MKKVKPVAMCPCAWCEQHPARALKHIGPKLKKDEHRGSYHHLNAWGARILRRINALGVSVTKTELHDLAYRARHEGGYDWIAGRTIVKNVRALPMPGVRRGWIPANIHERDREVGWLAGRLREMLAENERFGDIRRRTRSEILASLAKSVAHVLCQYGPSMYGRWPGEEYPQDTRARRAALALARALERYLRAGWVDAPNSVYEAARLAWLEYKLAEPHAILITVPKVLPSESMLYNLQPEELLSIVRLLRGPARYEARYPQRGPACATFVVIYAAESPNYRYPKPVADRKRVEPVENTDPEEPALAA